MFQSSTMKENVQTEKKSKSYCDSSMLLIVSSVLTFSALSFFLWFTDLYHSQLLKLLVIKNGSYLYDSWVKPPVSPLVCAYAFNYTNVEPFLKGYTDKLIVQENGPYCYKESTQKAQIQFHHNGTSISRIQINVEVKKPDSALFMKNVPDGLILPLIWMEIASEDMPENMYNLMYHATFSVYYLETFLMWTCLVLFTILANPEMSGVAEPPLTQFGIFVPELSKGRPDDVLIIPNVPYFIAVALSRNIHFVGRLSILTMLSNMEPFTKVKAHDSFFGYDNALVTIGNTIARLTNKPVTYDKFGMLLSRTGLSKDLLTVWTGEEEPELAGQVASVNGVRELNTWLSPECNVISGSDGSRFPPTKVGAKAPVSIFSRDSCRSLPLVYHTEAKLEASDTQEQEQ
ncbi:lysosome membrane protein 2 [Diaphorina citri]|uniref:Scavenger receptor class B member 1 n=1 Tax=Diaphorina citri TaxID=121845 RepID=A0A1S4EM92_DIACI|nr:lysosome membrane protein 2 [Diaphorina citri]